METVDTVPSTGSVDTGATDSVDSIQAPTTGEIQPETTTTQPATYQPFANGKEKFLIDGKEVEMDFDTAKRSIQLARASQMRMEKAAEVERNAQRAYQEFMEAIQRDPESLIKHFRPEWTPTSTAAQATSTTPQAGQGDPRLMQFEQMLQQQRNELQATKQELQSFHVERAKQEIAVEMDAAIKKFPVLNNEINKHYVKAQYKAALADKLPVSIEDIAFIVAQQLEQEKLAQVQNNQKKLEENRKKAPVSTPPAGLSAKKETPKSFDDVRKMAGLM